MKVQLNILTTDGEQSEVTCIVPDFVAWERHSKRKISDLAAGIAMEDLAFLAHSALKRQGQVKPFEGWLASVEEIELVELDPKATQ